MLTGFIRRTSKELCFTLGRVTFRGVVRSQFLKCNLDSVHTLQQARHSLIAVNLQTYVITQKAVKFVL
jgi:hypothetical protein